ncbi:hypothetical protein B5180_06050, partial [Streptomyces sp. BF-3]
MDITRSSPAPLRVVAVPPEPEPADLTALSEPAELAALSQPAHDRPVTAGRGRAGTERRVRRARTEPSGRRVRVRAGLPPRAG